MVSTAKTLARRTLTVPGIASFRNHVESKLASLRQAPILVISSEVPQQDAPSSSSVHNNSAVAESCKVVQFTLAQQFGLRTVLSGISSAVPLTSDLGSRLDLLRRTGAAHVVGVGSGAALDLAKALHVKGNHHNKNDDDLGLILVPATPGAVLVSGTSRSLLLDSTEETLVPYPTTTTNESTSSTTTTHKDASVVVLPMDVTHKTDNDATLYAAIALILDACYRQSHHPQLSTMIQTATDLLKAQQNINESEKTAMTASDLLFQSAGLISYGLDGTGRLEERRSIPIALGAATIPRLFPTTPMIDFVAGLVPGLCQLLKNSGQKEEGRMHLADQLLLESMGNNNHRPPKLKFLDASLKGFQASDMAISHLHDNQATWNGLMDHPDQVLLHVLEHSLSK